MENIGTRGKIIYDVLKAVDPEVQIEVLTDNEFKAMYLKSGNNCQPVIEMGSNWYRFMDCNGNVLSQSDRFGKLKHVRREVFVIKKAFVALNPNLTQRIALENQKSHPLLQALQTILPGDVEIIDGFPGYSAQGFQVRATSPKTLHVIGNQFGNNGTIFDNLSPKNVASKLGERLF